MNIEISINYTNVHETWDKKSIIIDDIFTYACAREFIETYDIELCSDEECQRRADWPS